MLETKLIETNRKNMFKKEVKYVEPVREGATAITKEGIISRYSETYQLNIMRKAILGDTEALTELQEMEDFINGKA